MVVPLRMLLLGLLLAGCSSGEEPPVERPAPQPLPRVEEQDTGPPPEPDAGPRIENPISSSHLALGGSHSCIFADGEVSCWGGNQFGQLGDPALARGRDAHRARPRVVADLTDVASIAAGAFHTCALHVDGRVSCWGHGGFGQLGRSEGNDGLRPAPVEGLRTAVEVAPGRAHTCARLYSGRVACWGRDLFGQLGAPAGGDHVEPQVVPELAGVVALGAGRDHTCAVTAEDVRCWGANFEAQLGDGTFGLPDGFRSSPVVVLSLEPPSALSLGTSHACCVVGATATCWGGNDAGQLGGTGSGARRGARAVSGVADVLEVAAGSRHSCALSQGGQVRCWGLNRAGQLGDGTETSRRAPARVRPLPPARHVAAGAVHTCAIAEDDRVFCWGKNNRAQLGGGGTDNQNRPVRVPGF